MTGTIGQDWASYQPEQPATIGLGFVFVKATEGTGYINPKYAAQIAHARATVPVVGSYHYPHMAADPAVEVAYFLAAAKPKPGDVLTLDWEGYDPANKGVSWARKIAYKDAYLAHLAAAMPGNQVGTYCPRDYLNQDPNGHYGDFLWIATANLAAGLPGITRPWLFHQYGTAGDIDHDYTPLTAAQLKSWAHAKENDDTMTPADIKAVAVEVVKELTAAGPRDELAFASLYWLRRGLDPTITLAAGADAPSAAAEAAKFRASLAAFVATHAGAALTDDQVLVLADRLAANPGFATSLGGQIVAQAAARLQP